MFTRFFLTAVSFAMMGCFWVKTFAFIWVSLLSFITYISKTNLHLSTSKYRPVSLEWTTLHVEGQCKPQRLEHFLRREDPATLLLWFVGNGSLLLAKSQCAFQHARRYCWQFFILPVGEIKHQVGTALNGPTAIIILTSSLLRSSGCLLALQQGHELVDIRPPQKHLWWLHFCDAGLSDRLQG